MLALVRRGPVTVKAIVATLYEDTPAPLLPVAAKQVYAHLKKLRDDGKVTGRDARGVWNVVGKR